MDSKVEINGFVTGYPRLILRLEGALVFVSCLICYYQLGFLWKSFFILCLLPDISFAGYLFGKKVGSITYNICHSYILPIILGIVSWYYKYDVHLSIIWIAHIGFDRFLGYGLKYSKGFAYTHLGAIAGWRK